MASHVGVPSVRDRKRQLGLAQEQTLPLPGLGRPLCYIDSVGLVAGVLSSSICLLLLQMRLQQVHCPWS